MIKLYTPVGIILTLLLHPAIAATVPPNDDQCNPYYIGVLDQPTDCPFSSANSTWLINQSNVGSTSTFPQPALMSCMGGGDMPNPMNDVWYKFEASADYLDVFINGTINTPYVALYQYTGDCIGMIPINCARGLNGNLSASFPSLFPGTEYLLQVGGTTTGSFTLILSNSNNCLSCMQKSMLFVSPAPVNGYYNPGDTVNFCYVVNGFKSYNGQSLHGVVPVLPTNTGWQPPTLQPMNTPQSVSGNGAWMWYNYPSLPQGLGTREGFFYDVNPLNMDPTDNAGDSASAYDQWIFCWSMVTKSSCTGFLSLNFDIYHFSDGETGSGVPTLGCGADKDYRFSAVLNCCSPGLDISVADASCDTVCDGNISASVSGITIGPYNYFWFDNTGYGFDSTLSSVSTINSVSGLCAGSYSVIMVNSACFATANATIAPPFAIDVQQATFTCGTSSNEVAMVTVNPNVGNYTYSWSNGDTSPAATGLSTGQTYTVTVTDVSTGCAITQTITIMITPQDDPAFLYPSNQLCQTGNALVYPVYIATPGGTFSSSNQTNMPVDPATGEINVAASNIGMYTVMYVTNGPCPATYVDTIYITSQDDAFFSYPNTVVCGAPLLPMYPDYMATLGGTFTVSGAGCLVDSSNGALSVFLNPNPTIQCIVTYTSPNTGACQDVHMDTITFNKIPATPTSSNPNVFYCAGDQASLTVAVIGNGVIPLWFDTAFSWTLPVCTTSTYTFTPTQPFYTLTVIAYDLFTGCASAPIYLTLTESPAAVADAGSDTTICPDFTTVLQGSGGVSYSWLPDNSTAQNLSVSPGTTTTYTLIVTNNAGCTASDFVTVTVDSAGCDTIDIKVDYNGITPNGDGYNDAWFINGISHIKNKVLIFNRWGDKVWEGTNYDNRDVIWTGRNMSGSELPAGTYYYVIHFEDLPARKGWVELTR
ncbi:MAG: gliding motility-associated C-terminal domain-containing protein [Bacteroidota bacterium]